MKAWWLDYHPAFDRLEFENTDDFTLFDSIFVGGSLKRDWNPPAMKFVDRGRPTDFLYRKNGCLFVSERVVQLLAPYENFGVIEFLPVLCDAGTYFVLHGLNPLDCVDQKKSKEDRVPSGQLIGYKELELQEDAVRNQDFFRVKMHDNNQLLREIFVSDQVADFIRQSDLQGYQLLSLWNSEMTNEEMNIKWNVMGELVNISLVKTFNFDKAVQYARKNKVIVYNGKNAMKIDENNNLLIGTLQLDGSYVWIDPVYILPVFLYEEWGIKEEPKLNILGKLREVLGKK